MCMHLDPMHTGHMHAHMHLDHMHIHMHTDHMHMDHMQMHMYNAQGPHADALGADADAPVP